MNLLACRLVCRLILVFICLGLPNLAMAQGIAVQAASIAVGGKVQIQKEGERIWRNISKKITISDGDILKTGPKSFIVVQIGDGNIAVIGADSRALINFNEYDGDANLDYTTSFTLFEGGAHFKWKGQSYLNVFSSNAVGRSTEGVFSLLFDTETEVGSIVSLQGDIGASNISRSKIQKVGPGLFTTISQDNEPSQPEALSAGMVERMRSFFGESFVNRELEAAGIEIKQDEALQADAGSGSQESGLNDPVRIRGFFKGTDVLSSLDEKMAGEKVYYRPPHYVDPLASFPRYYLETGFRLSNVQNSSYFGLETKAVMNFGSFRAGLNLPLESAPQGFKVNTFTTIPGILDKIYMFEYGSVINPVYLKLGEIEDITFNRGLLFHEFDNDLKSQIEQPRGLFSQFQLDPTLDLIAFIPDLSKPTFLGLHLGYDAALSMIGASLAIDAGQGSGLTIGDAGFNAMNPPVVDHESNTGMIWAWDLLLEFNMLNDPPLYVNGYGGLAYLYEGLNAEGMAFKAPGVEVLYKKWKFYLEGWFSNGRLRPEYFNRSYLEDRTRVYTDNSGETWALSQAERHPIMNGNRGGRFGWDYQILKWMWVGAAAGQNIFSGRSVANIPFQSEVKNPQVDIKSEATPEFLNRDRFYEFRIFTNGDLIRFIPRFEISWSVHNNKLGRPIVVAADSSGTVRPQLTTGEDATWYLSPNTEGKVLGEFQVLPNATIVAQYLLYTLDLETNGIYDEGELISEFGLTWRMTF